MIKKSGTDFLYEVVRPNSSLQVTSSKIKGDSSIKKDSTTLTKYEESSKTTSKEKTEYKYGVYTLYAYNTESYGTEIQTFTVGGEGIDLSKQENKTVTTIDVGYQYIRTPYELKVKKIWNNSDENIQIPNATVFEICYTTNNGESTIYEERALSGILSWNNAYEYLETNIGGHEIKDWYVSAEYYIYKDKIFRHKFSYNPSKGIYESFVGDNSYFSLSEYYQSQNKDLSEKKVYNIEDIPDLNGDGLNNWNDLKMIKDEPEDTSSSTDGLVWKKASPAGTNDDSQVVAPFNSVLDRNVGTAVTEINITNASNPGTIEILKYTGDLSENNFLDGATFRVYEGDIDIVKEKIDAYNEAQRKLNEASEDDEPTLREELNKASDEVDKIQVASASTRVNGKIAFAGLDVNKTYTVRERFAPSGYRILEEYYQVNSKSSTGEGNKFNENNYCLLNIGNIEASGDLEIRKTLQGRAWTDDDSFSFDLNVTDVNVSNEDKEFFNRDEYKDTESLINDFKEKFNEDSEITIDKNTPFAILNDNSTSADTKVYKDILESGIVDDENKEDINEETKASLLNNEFPAEGTYTVTMQEKSLDDKNLEYSTRLYTIIIDVSRVLNEGVEDNKEISLANSHLEASVSKITYQEKNSENGYGESYIFAGNNPIFINNYIVQDVEQSLKYIVQKNLKGRENNNWTENDKFSFTISGYDPTTQDALKNGNIIIKSAEGDSQLKLSEDKSEITFEINNENEKHQFSFGEIDFHNIEFPVENVNGESKTKPIIYYLQIKENTPENADDGITYSKDVYTLKLILENSEIDLDSENKDILNSIILNDSVDQEKDGIVDKIILELYKNYNFNEGAENSPISECEITQSKDSTGKITKSEKHDGKENSHTMIFENQYNINLKVKKIWDDSNDLAEKRPNSIKLNLQKKVNGMFSKIDTVTLTDSDSSEDNKNEWEHVFKNIPLYDDTGNKIEYKIEEEYNDSLKFYVSKSEELKEVKDEKNTYEIDLTNTFKVPDEKIDISVDKIWEFENEKQAERIPESINVTISTDDPKIEIPEKSKTLELTKSNDLKDEDNKITWENKFTGLTKYDELGNEVEYKVTEESDNKFYRLTKNEKDDTGKIILTNTFKSKEEIEEIEKINLKVTKNWEDNEIQAQRRPKNITIKLNGSNGLEKTETIEVDNNSTQTYTFENLPKYDKDGQEVEYTVKELGVDDLNSDLKFYNSKVEKQTESIDSNKEVIITNTFKTKEQIEEIEKIDINVTKTWIHTNNIYNKPSQIKLELKNGDNIVSTQILNSTNKSDSDENTWKYVFENIPKYDDQGQEIKYKVAESEVETDDLKYYQSEISEIEDNNINITNTYIGPVISSSKAVRNTNDLDYAREGDILEYTITVKNDGQIDKDVTIKDKAPDGTNFIDGSIKINGQANYESTDFSQKRESDLENGITVKVPKKDEIKLSFNVKVKYSKEEFKITNIASVDDTQTTAVDIQYQKIDPQLSSTIEKKGTEKIVSKDTSIYYELKFNAKVNDYIGKASVELVDTLPFPIDVSHSDLSGGIYNESNKTITWKEDFNNIDTIHTGKEYEAIFNKSFYVKYLYGDINKVAGSMENKVNSTIKLLKPNDTNPEQDEIIKEETQNASKVTSIEIPAKVIVHHYIYDEQLEPKETLVKLVDDEELYGFIGNEYTATSSSNIPKNYECIEALTQNAKGKFEEGVIEVKFYYKLKNPTLNAVLNKQAKIEVLKKEDGLVNYSISYQPTIQDYIGKAKVEIVDKLPAKIDLEKSDILYGNYDEQNQTISWIDEIEINTYDNIIPIITKEINIVYKDQNLVQDLENTAIGKITIYYPENHSSKPNEEWQFIESQDSATIHQEYKANLKIEKEWDDSEDLRGKRPDSVTIKIIEQPSGKEELCILNAENNWTYLKENVPKYDETGNKITYEVTEQETNTDDLIYYDAPEITLIEEQTDEITNYKYKVKNKYRLLKTELNTQLTKQGSKEITSSKDIVNYTISLKAEIKDYIGNSEITIVDTLPYKIDIEKSKIAEGIYNDEEQTITWKEKLQDLNTVEEHESHKVNLEKQISVVYKDIDLTQEKMTNYVNAEIKLIDKDLKDEAQAKYDTNINVNGKIIVRYIDKDSGKELSKEEIKEKVGTEYKTEKREFENYLYLDSTNNETGKVKEETQEVIYYYSRIKTSVLVKYQDKQGNKLADDLLIKGQVEDEYKTEPKIIKNYKNVENTNNISGKMTKEQIEVIYIYEKLPAKVIVKYLEKDTEKELLNPEIINGFAGDKYQVQRKVVENYRIAGVEPENAIGDMTEEEILVKFYYEKIPSGTIFVKYIDIDTDEEITYSEFNVLGEPEKKSYGYNINGYVGEEFMAEKKEIPYYVFLANTDNTNGILKEQEDTIIYYYRKQIFNIKVNEKIESIKINGKQEKISNNKLTKIEFRKNRINDIDIIVNYSIEVINTGEIDGKTKIEYLIPNGFKIDKMQNDWNLREDGIIETEVELKAGECKILPISLKWINSSENLGEKGSFVNILETQNNANYKENKMEDNTSSATLIVSISTGIIKDKTNIMNLIIISMILVTSYVLYENFKKKKS